MFSFKRETHYIYAFVRKDIPLANQIVQVGHACHEAGTKYGKKKPHLVLLEVRDEHDLMGVSNHAKKHGIKFEIFHEPDLIEDRVGGYTAMCTEPIKGKRREAFKDCVLWKL